MTVPVQGDLRPPSRKRQGGVVVPHAPKWYQRVGGFIIYMALRAVNLTLRYRWHDRSGLLTAAQKPGPSIYCIWHNRLALCLFLYERYIFERSGSQGLAAMVSASRDGGFLTSILELFRVKPVRGSSSRRGPQALRELTTWLRRDHDLALTPDGPRGPRYVVQDGVVALGQLTGRPIVAVTYNVSRKIQVRSWDRFQIPIPFSTVDVYFAPAMRVPRESSEADRERLRQHLQNAMNEFTKD